MNDIWEKYSTDEKYEIGESIVRPLAKDNRIGGQRVLRLCSINKLFRFLILFLIALPSSANALDPGIYTISFRIADMGFTQKIDLRNFRESPNKSFVGFDLYVKEKGALKRFPEDSAIVQGIIYNGKFKFIIPFANVSDVYSFNFAGVDELKNGNYVGSGDVFFNSSTIKDEYTFIMKRDAN